MPRDDHRLLLITSPSHCTFDGFSFPQETALLGSQNGRLTPRSNRGLAGNRGSRGTNAIGRLLVLVTLPAERLTCCISFISCSYCYLHFYGLKLRRRKIKELASIRAARKRRSQNSNPVFIWKIRRPVALQPPAVQPRPSEAGTDPSHAPRPRNLNPHPCLCSRTLCKHQASSGGLAAP